MVDTRSDNPSSVENDDSGATPHGSISSKLLLEHSREAMIAAIEIYNKPTIMYRNECTVVLVINSWELVLKALLVLNNQSISDQKIPSRTLTWRNAWLRSQQFLPPSLANRATQSNLEILARYRDQVIHHYHSQHLGMSLYLLLQAAIANYRDLVIHAWSIDIADDITWHLLPIGMTPPGDIASFFAKTAVSPAGSATSNFLADIRNDLVALTSSGEDVDRFLIKVEVRLESLKTVGSTDAVVGIAGKSDNNAPNVIIRRQDPNQTHPFRQKEVLGKIKKVGDKEMTSYVFQAIIWKYQLKRDGKYCWVADGGTLTKYSSETVKLIRSLSTSDVDEAIRQYRNHLHKQRQRQA